jgi:Mg-chelatase subunit ChlD
MPVHKPLKKLVNHVAIVLDESGSMDPMRKEAIDAFNDQIKTIKAGDEKQETTVSLVKFNTEVPEPVFWELPVANVRKITTRDYRPNGMTALLDAIGLTVDRLSALPDAEDSNTSFLVIIISDGEENNSKEFSHAPIADRIEKLEKTERWTFVFLGANQDMLKVAQEFKITMLNVAQFAASPSGMRDASASISKGLSRHMVRKARGMHASRDFFSEDIEDKPEEPDK